MQVSTRRELIFASILTFLHPRCTESANAADSREEDARRNSSSFALAEDSVTGAPTVQLSFEDKRASTFVVDTGFSACSVTSTWADEYRLIRSVARTTSGMTLSVFSERDEICRPGSAQLGSFKLGSRNAMLIIPHPYEAPFVKSKVAGVLGMNLLSQAVWHFQFSKSTLHVYRPMYFREQVLPGLLPHDSIDLSRVAGGCYAANIKYGGVAEPAVIDTGGISTILSESGATKAGLAKNAKESTLQTLFSTERVMCARSKLSIGNLDIGEVDLCYMKGLKENSKQKVGPLLGRNVLSNLDPIFDFPSSKMYVIRRN